jgi:hypothetical protein
MYFLRSVSEFAVAVDMGTFLTWDEMWDGLGVDPGWGRDEMTDRSFGPVGTRLEGGRSLRQKIAELV